jgi:hypothetical protein
MLNNDMDGFRVEGKEKARNQGFEKDSQALIM